MWLGGLVLSLHEETGYGAMPSVLREAKSGSDIPMSELHARPDGIDGIARRGDRWIFIELRRVNGDLGRVEKVVDDTFVAGWRREEEPPSRGFDYCVVSGVPIPVALCPPAGDFPP